MTAVPAEQSRPATTFSDGGLRCPPRPSAPPSANGPGRALGGTRCLLADDHPALRVCLVSYLEEAGFEIVGPAVDGIEALALAARDQPELAVIDLNMPRCGGRQLVRGLRETAPGMRIAVYTADVDAVSVPGLLEAGAHAVVLKEAPLDDLVRALDAVAAGRPYVDPALAGETASPNGPRREPTARELEVLALLAEGLSHEKVGKRLDIGAETVRTHARKAADRLGARTRTQAVALAIRRGLLE